MIVLAAARRRREGGEFFAGAADGARNTAAPERNAPFFIRRRAPRGVLLVRSCQRDRFGHQQGHTGHRST